MKVLVLSWEYPPRSIGGVSTHVYNLSQSLKDKTHDVCIVTCSNDNSISSGDDNRVTVYRVVPLSIPTNNFIEWVNHLNYSMIEQCVKLIKEGAKFDVIHVHDWLVAYSGKVLSESYNLPLVTTIHSTESGRNNGIHTEMQRYIHSVENFIIQRSNRVVSCSEYMKEHIAEVFNYKKEDITVIPNGVNSNMVEINSLNEFRQRYANDDEKIIFFIGRHVYEKGIQLLIDAVPSISLNNPKIKFIIAGTGPMTEELKHKAYLSGVSDKVLFIGFISDDDKTKIYKCSNVVVIPSLYEPFGMVALEAMAAGCPVLASDCGGLKEIIHNEFNGITFQGGSIEDLSKKLSNLLVNENLRELLVSNGKITTEEKYSWDKAADKIENLYTELTAKKKKSSVKRVSRKSNKDEIKIKEELKEDVKKTKKSGRKKIAETKDE